ncbi:MAG: SfnB family sulfur acquisition oxidoreductase [Nocardiaceae bacterium]|nr:SfnB family sulfur acquisition oxidoreductase [Nocardiaceae bacterium]
MTAHRIRSADEALDIAIKLAAEFSSAASERDRTRRLPERELDALSDSGLLAISVPARFGGADVDVLTIAEVFRTLATVDASIAQIPHSHFVFLDAIRRQGSTAQQARVYGPVLGGARLANAQSERGGKTITDDSTTLSHNASGDLELNGTKYYSTGALYADLLVVRAVSGDHKVLVYLPKSTPGIVVTDDWDGLGQRTTASGTVVLDQVPVEADQVVDFTSLFDGPTTFGARAQLLHSAIDVGIARGALDAAVSVVGSARPWFEADVDRATDDPLVLQQAGELEVKVRAAEALLREAGRSITAAESELSATTAAEASIATAAAKVAAGRASVEVSSALFELGGTRSAADKLNLSRYWRDARTHTLHDPERWKIQHIGRWTLNQTFPPRHGQI